jgi:hypothetical protein
MIVAIMDVLAGLLASEGFVFGVTEPVEEAFAKCCGWLLRFTVFRLALPFDTYLTKGASFVTLFPPSLCCTPTSSAGLSTGIRATPLASKLSCWPIT